MKISARGLALNSLIKCTNVRKYSNLEVAAMLSKTPLDPRDRALYTALVYGVIEREMTLDFVISKYSKSKIESLDPDVLVILRLGAYQILFADRIPDFSACDESVKLARPSARSFVNAVLRQVVKNKDCLKDAVSRAPLSIRYSVPEWIVDIWREGYGEEKTLEILDGFEKRPPMTVRVNTLKISTTELLKRLEENGIDCAPHPEVEDMICINSGSPEGIQGFSEGLFFVQGTNSKRAVSALSLKKGERVVDVCACPGGKTFSAAIDMENEGEIFSFDLHKNKLSLIDKGAERLGLGIITTAERNAYLPSEELLSRADAVICDVPCSGLGIIAKKPDIKYKDPSDIERLPEIQQRILTESSKYLKKGGRLLYSTCTLNPAENERVTERFLSQNKGFRRESGYPVTAFPDSNSDDGFFYDLIVKDKDE